MVAVGYTRLSVVQQGDEYNGSVDADLRALLQMISIPDSLVAFLECAVWLGRSVFYFPVDLGI